MKTWIRQILATGTKPDGTSRALGGRASVLECGTQFRFSVAPVSKPAVSPISKSAGRGDGGRVQMTCATRIGKSAIQQTRRSALRFWQAALLLVLLLAAGAARAVDFHVATAQELQNALTLAAANGADDNIYLTNGYYVGNFNFNSTEARNLTLLPEAGLTNTGITIAFAGGRTLNLSSSSASANTLTVQGITFLRDCGNSSIGALRIAAGSSATILVNGCRFLSPTNASGTGLEIVSGLNASVTNCVVAGDTSGGEGTGISISGVTGNVSVQSCAVSTNLGFHNSGNGGGLNISDNAVVVVAGNTFSGNSFGEGYVGGATCSGTTVTLSNNTFTGNSAGAGGGALCSGTTVTLSGNTFTGNSASDGGGAYCFGTTITLSGNTFTGNYLDGRDGGGAYCSGTTITLSGNTFTGNYGGVFGGGGAYCDGTTVTLSGNTFAGNSAGDGGGALCSGTTVTLSGNTFTGNSVYSYGGGGASCFGGDNSTMTLSNNTFIGNSAGGGAGGGAYCTIPSYYYNGTIILSGNTARLNTADSGGGLYVDSPTVRLLDNLVVNNAQSSSSSKGGGVYVNARTNLDMINNTVSGNTAVGNGGGVAYQVDGFTEVLNVFNNIIWGNTADGFGADVHLAGSGLTKKFMFNDAHDLYGVWDTLVNNLDVSPQFFDPVNGDYHIQTNSPCKDAGTNGAPSLPATDLDGEPRIANGTVDLGCYEFATTAKHPADVNVNFVLTAAEFTDYAAAWKAGQTWSNAPLVIPADYVTRAGYLMTNGGAYHNDGSARPVNWKIGP